MPLMESCISARVMVHNSYTLSEMQGSRYECNGCSKVAVRSDGQSPYRSCREDRLAGTRRQGVGPNGVRPSTNVLGLWDGVRNPPA
jgi:hypothetical protein